METAHEPDNARSRGKVTLNWNYPEVIAQAGGVPMLIPPTADMEEVAKLLDGWLIPGGLDIDASRFGEPNHPAVELQDPSRYDSEAALYRAADPNLPILGICYGCQFLNVIRGGSLNQHLPDALGHDGHTVGTEESYQVDPSSHLAQIVGTKLKGLSYHHQAAARLGQGLRVTARAEDGTIEAVEATDRPWTIGVQWHPERSPDDASNRALIQKFVEAAAKYAVEKGKR